MASSDHTTNVETAKSKSPSPSSESPNNVNTNEEPKAAKETTVADTKQPEIKDVEMQDAEVACNKPDIVEEKSTKDGETNETASDLKASERSESSEKQRDESGQDHVLGEVATLLKQVQESETKGKIEVEAVAEPEIYNRGVV
ncbi:hypothetical protein HanRHA438_Chr16g0738561 [Helianthus annuus]|nr:hypothetical protein HanLR1_Chr16g0603071 [Helianthus annuus]KAJ0643346.1 hypothetical protein HanOQP8_Chr16g0599581 [Helianthus annuus]KAJ0833973.1 hypothetical protein HanRHA438_Chr16g0738561 [Helianthus annuus]